MDGNFPKLRMDAKAQINKVQEHQPVKIPKKCTSVYIHLQILEIEDKENIEKKPKKGKKHIGAKIRITYRLLFKNHASRKNEVNYLNC